MIYTVADFPVQRRPAAEPYRIFAAMLDRTLGDFLCRGYYAATAKMNRYGPTQLTAYWVNDRPYKRPLIRLNPYIDQQVIARDGETLPLDSFYDTGDRRPLPASAVIEQVQRIHARADIILTPSMMLIADLPRFDKFPLFKIPPTERGPLAHKLVEMGLDPSRFYAVLFYRLPNYVLRGPTPYRDVQDEDIFRALRDYIIDELGGQVVRIGHVGMAEWPKRAGFIDLSRIDDIMLHAAAVSRARFAVVTSSGPALLPPVFDVPCAIVNAVSGLGAFRKDTLVLPRPIWHPNGHALDVDKLRQNGLWTDAVVRDLTLNHGHFLRDNSVEELQAVAAQLHEATAAVKGWRPWPGEKG